MDPRIESVYLIEILAQVRNGRRARRAMQEALAALERRDAAARGRIAELFDDAADFLAHAANVSKILWPPRPGNSASARSLHLQAGLALSPGHALEDRKLRNHLEHYDERLDSWAATSVNRNIVDGVVGQRSAIGGPGIADSDIMRLYDPTTHTFVFRGESFDLQAIAAGLEDLAHRAEERMQKIAPALFAGLRSSRLI